MFSIFSKRPDTTKMKIMGLLASTVDYIIDNEGCETLLSGSLVLDANFNPSFRGGKILPSGDILAVVPIGDLSEAEFFRVMAEEGITDMSMCTPFIDQLVMAVVREFSAHCPEMAKIPVS